MHIHAIGDRAVTVALDSFEVAYKQNGPSNHRHHIAHLQLVRDLDIPRFKELGVSATFSLIWCYNDENNRSTDKVLGPERSLLQYPIKKLLQCGAMVCCGSDWPVSSVNPLQLCS